MKKFPWFLSFELGARQACDRRHRTMGTVHSGKISHLTWTFTKKYWAVLGCTGLYWAVLGHLRYLLGNVQVKWRILPLCIVLLLCSALLCTRDLDLQTQNTTPPVIHRRSSCSGINFPPAIIMLGCRFPKALLVPGSDFHWQSSCSGTHFHQQLP